MEQQLKKLNQARTDFLEASLELVEKQRKEFNTHIINLSFSLRENGATTWMIEMLKKYPNSVACIGNSFELEILKDKYPDLPLYWLSKDLKEDFTDKIIFLDLHADLNYYNQSNLFLKELIIVIV